MDAVTTAAPDALTAARQMYPTVDDRSTSDAVHRNWHWVEAGPTIGLGIIDIVIRPDAARRIGIALSAKHMDTAGGGDNVDTAPRFGH